MNFRTFTSSGVIFHSFLWTLKELVLGIGAQKREKVAGDWAPGECGASSAEGV